MAREKDINGKWIGNAIGYCHYPKHPGALNYELGYKHKCIAKNCRHLEKYSEDAWRHHTYHNRPKRVVMAIKKGLKLKWGKKE